MVDGTGKSITWTLVQELVIVWVELKIDSCYYDNEALYFRA